MNKSSGIKIQWIKKFTYEWTNSKGKILLENLIVPHLAKIIPVVYGTKKVITICMRRRRVSVKWARWIQPMHNQTYLKVTFDIHPCIYTYFSVICLPQVSTTITVRSLPSPTHSTHFLILLDLVVQLLRGFLSWCDADIFFPSLQLSMWSTLHSV